jgi:hypothetical protein
LGPPGRRESGDIAQRILKSQGKFNMLLITHELGVSGWLAAQQTKKSFDRVSQFADFFRIMG